MAGSWATPSSKGAIEVASRSYAASEVVLKEVCKTEAVQGSKTAEMAGQKEDGTCPMHIRGR